MRTTNKVALGGGMLLALVVASVMSTGDGGSDDPAGGAVLTAADGAASAPALSPAPDRQRPEQGVPVGAAGALASPPVSSDLVAPQDERGTAPRKPYVIHKQDGEPPPVGGGKPDAGRLQAGLGLRSAGQRTSSGAPMPPPESYNRRSPVPKPLRRAAPSAASGGEAAATGGEAPAPNSSGPR